VTDADRSRFAELMYALSETFDTKVSALRVQLYFDALVDLPIAAVERAARLAVGTLRFFPKPTELRELVQGNVEDEAGIAWAAFQREVSRVGYMREPDLPAATMDAIRLVFGDWRRACASLPSPDSDRAPELMGWRKQFIAAYGNVRRREERGELTSGEAKDLLASVVTYRQKQLRGESA
jgi:hypothetical protein